MPKELGPAQPGVIRTGKRLKFATTIIGATQIGRRDDSPFSTKQLKKKNAAEDSAKSGMVFNKGHGQHILRNPLVVNAIVEKSAIKPTDIVVEIGPGTGNLTERLLGCAKKVIAFEIDSRMVAELHKRFQSNPLGSKLQVIRGNCLDHDFPYFDRCVANVPYAISSALVFKLLQKPTFKCAVLMFQREFALRVCAPPGSDMYCRLSVNAQLMAKCSHLMKVSKNSFNPPPKVESSVIRLEPKNPPPPVDFEEWDGLVKLLFNRKNKKASAIFRTKTALQSLFDIYCSYCRMESKVPMPLDTFKAVIDTVLQDPLLEKRARTMTQDDILQLLNSFNAAGVHFH